MNMSCFENIDFEQIRHFFMCCPHELTFILGFSYKNNMVFLHTRNNCSRHALYKQHMFTLYKKDIAFL